MTFSEQVDEAVSGIPARYRDRARTGVMEVIAKHELPLDLDAINDAGYLMSTFLCADEHVHVDLYHCIDSVVN